MPVITEAGDDHKLELAAEVLISGHTLRLRAFGTSMLPSIWPGDILSVEPKPEQEIVAGDIVLVARRNRFFIHRLIEKHDSRWITRGDSLPHDDVPVNSSEVLGRVSLIHKKNRTIVANRRRPLFNRALAWMLCYSDIFRTVALRVHSLRQESSRESSAGILPAVVKACPRQ
jgi:Peptidase S24-like